ncbi:MAG: PEP/pyruvate-binding domain-containing protein [Proteobacteria bacterium]|nr:PEP/pyruvate-binding domain-containing protein [Pseudomonadota bacterium]
MKKFKSGFIVFVFILGLVLAASAGICFGAPTQPENQMLQWVQELKKDPRGPFQGIKWFCQDGQVLSAQERCPAPGGIQHGVLKDRVLRLEQDKKIYLSTQLAGLGHGEIWDIPGFHSRLKQYALIQYLFLADDGWIYQQARYYRGAVQAEDENAWGEGFLNGLLADQDAVSGQFFLVREACRTIPQPGLNKNRLETIRAVSKTLSDQLPDFMDLRIKLHGQPDSNDTAKVQAFLEKRNHSLDERQKELFAQLTADLEAVYASSRIEIIKKRLSGKIARIPELSGPIKSLGLSIDRSLEPKARFSDRESNPYQDMADLLFGIRSHMSSAPPGLRLSLMNLSLALEKHLFSSIGNWQPLILADLFEKCRILSKAAAGCGYMEIAEWTAAQAYGFAPNENPMGFSQFQLKAEQIRRVVDWGASMVRATYLPEVTLYQPFAPLAQGFVDDRIRSSLLLPLGAAVGKLTRFAQASAGISNHLPPGIDSQGVRGVNPGVAHGILEVLSGSADSTMEMDSKKIYVFKTIPSELKPVSGMLAVSEGNPVSHIQLLARNLGIPNTIITAQTLDRLLPYAGQKIFYAVSQKGAVVLKTESDLTQTEQALIQTRQRKSELFRVPVEKIELEKNTPIPLSLISATDSGRICGPKAANLGQLKSLFPDKVIDGIVLPFGIFRDHMDQAMPGKNTTYWQYLKNALSDPSVKETDLIATLADLQAAIRTMPFLPGFETTLSALFDTTFRKSLGKVPVFIRSDTNMEDIPEFTGAGLNLTLFNIRDRELLFQGIREVWASPYKERSYLWRQKYLQNPENVFPSILLLPSINVEKSGVVITHGIVSNDPQDITVAFSQGVGGAVDGQTAETYLLTDAGENILLSPARELISTRLAEAGGIEKQFVRFDHPILNAQDLLQIRKLVQTLRRVLPGTPGIDGKGPFDIELGFKNDRMHLFQVRPFVENKRANTLNYLLNLDKNDSGTPPVFLDQTIGF